MTDWNRRIERAEELERVWPAAAELLRFYRAIVEWRRQGGTQSGLWSILERGGRAEPEAARALFEQLTRLPAPQSAAGNLCPRCGGKPVAAVLRPEGEGARRSLLCSHCSEEWDFRRLLCPNCGEEVEAKLPVFTTDTFRSTYISACDTCRVYIKTVDLSRDGLAVPEVDEIAAVALDLWAQEQGYRKLQTNCVGL